MRYRSILAVPGHRTDLFPKAMVSGADAIMLDLEDSVPHHLYRNAMVAVKDTILKFYRTLTVTHPVLMVRIRTMQDVPEVVPYFISPPQLVIPKAGENDGYELQEIMKLAGTRCDLWPIIETPKGLLRVESLAKFDYTKGLIVGAEDMKACFGRRHNGTCRHRDDVLVCAKAYGKVAIDTAYCDGPACMTHGESSPWWLQQAEYQESYSNGFDGVICLNPQQVIDANENYRPTPEDLEWAHDVLEVEGDGSAKRTNDGTVCGAPTYKQARAILTQAEAK